MVESCGKIGERGKGGNEVSGEREEIGIRVIRGMVGCGVLMLIIEKGIS